MSEWRSMESAPTNGVRILGYRDGVISVCRVKRYPTTHDLWCSQWVALAADRPLTRGVFRSDVEWIPTMWMPLPAVPRCGACGQEVKGTHSHERD